MIVLEQVSKRFGRKSVLDKVSYTFDKGVYGLLGPNGAGKTTLMRCMAGIYSLNGGDILQDGISISKNRKGMSSLGYLPQKFGAFQELSVYDAMRMLANLKGFDDRGTKAMIEECIAKVNLTDVLRSKVRTLSGGMLRRVGVAQTLLGDPPVIMFDEPTSGLDPEERLRFKSIISEIKKDRTIIISTHIVEDVEAVCDTITIMKNRSICTGGSITEIKSAAEGKAYVFADKEEINGSYYTEKQFEEDGQIMLRVLTAELQKKPPVTPTVEDGYLCILNDI